MILQEEIQLQILLGDWGLVEVKGDSTPTAPLSQIKIISFKEKMNGYLKRNIT